MIRSLKIKHFIFLFLAACIFWAITATILICNIDNIKILFEKPVVLNELTAEDIKEGVRVNASINLIYDYYSYYQEDGKTTSKEYLIPVGNAEYMGLVCSGTNMQKADVVMQLFWDYTDGKDVSEDSIQTMQVTGTIMPLEGESLRFYQQYIDQIDWTEEEKKSFLPYALMAGKIGNENMSGLVVCGIFSLVTLVIGILLLINGIKGGNIQVLEKYCMEKGNKEMYMRRIEEFYHAGIPVQGIRINTEYFMAIKGVNLYFAETGDLLWVYPNIVKHSVNGIPAGKTYSLIVKMTNGKQFNIQMKNEAAVNEAMEYVIRNMPYLIIGYNDEISKVYNKNRIEMIQVVAERRKNMKEEWGIKTCI